MGEVEIILKTDGGNQNEEGLTYQSSGGEMSDT